MTERLREVLDTLPIVDNHDLDMNPNELLCMGVPPEIVDRWHAIRVEVGRARTWGLMERLN